MQRVRFGRTELQVSPAGLGCGGSSRLGLATGGDERSAERLVRQALAKGVNFLDTARVYGTEEVVGRAIASRRSEVVVSSKSLFTNKDGTYISVVDLVASLEKSIKRIQSDYIDVFSLHGVTEKQLDYCLDEYIPELERQKALGKIRHIGITESFGQEPQHEMLSRAIPIGCFDVVMVGFNFLNQTARKQVLQLSIEHDVAVLVMHAVRRALSNAERLREIVVQLAGLGEVDPEIVDLSDPVGFLRESGESITDIAYRYCRYETGVSVVLTGTGNPEHLEKNISAINGDPVPDSIRGQLDQAFSRVQSTSAD